MLNPHKLPRVKGSHAISGLNFDPEATGELDFPDPLLVIDSTLRKCHFTAGATNSEAGYVRMAEALGELGIKHESININWQGTTKPGTHDMELLRAAGAQDYGFTLNVYSDALLSNGRDPLSVPLSEVVDTLVSGGADVLAPGIVPAPDADSQKHQRDELYAYFEYTKSQGIPTTITLAQVALRDFEQMVEMANLAAELGALRFDLMDSFSSLSLHAMPIFVRRFRQGLTRPVPVTMHAHNEFGLASAGAIMAAAAGASPDVSMNAVSYRCGFAALEEVILTLETFYGQDTGIALENIQKVSDLVSTETGIYPGEFKALTGPFAFLKHMPGDAAAAIADPQQFPPISHGLVAEKIGRKVTWVWGSLSCEDMVKNLGEKLELQPSTAEVPVLQQALDAEVDHIPTYPRWLEPDQAADVYRRTLRLLRGQLTSDDIESALLSSAPTVVLADRLITATTDTSPALVPATVWDTVTSLGEDELREALTGVNPLGHTPEGTSAQDASSRREEAGISGAESALRGAIAALSAEYSRRQGLPLVIATDGLSAEEIIATATSRLGATSEQALNDTRMALAQILSARVRKALEEASK